MPDAATGSVFEPVAEEHDTIKSLARTRPYAIGIRKTITGMRFYVGSPVWLEAHEELSLTA